MTGDYDAVILGHSQFEKIAMSEERQRSMLNQQLDEIIDGIAEMSEEEGAKSYTVKQMEKMKKSIEARLAKLNDRDGKDTEVTFEELGINKLCVDEAHFYKDL